jgi:hypothetical protein
VTRAPIRLAALAMLVLAGACAATVDPPPAAQLGRPEWRVGDRWLFRRIAFAGSTVMVTHEVTEATAEGYLMRITRLNHELTRHWTRDLALRRHTVRDEVLNQFEPPARYFSWPLLPGKTWRQEFEYRDGRADGRYANTWRVAKEAERIDITAGWFVALRVERLDAAGQPLETYWYVPVVRYWVRHVDHVNGFGEELVEFRPDRL